MKGFYGCIVLIFLASAAFSQTINSAQDGPWSLGSTWVGGVVPTNINSSSIVIDAGHVVNYDVVAGPGVDQISVLGTLEIDPGTLMALANGAGDEINVAVGGELTINGTLAFGGIPNRIVVINGTLNNNGTFTGVSAAKLTFSSGSNYFHQFADGGVIPAATWNANSTMNIVGYTSGNSTPPTGLAQAFGNFVWNSPGQDVSIELNAQPTSITGDFRVEGTGGDALFYSIGGAGNTMNVVGDLIVNGGTLGWTTGDAAISFLNIGGSIDVSGGGYLQLGDDIGLTVNLTGNFVLSGGAIDFSASSAITNLNIQGNYTHTGGDIFVNGGTGNVNFIGASSKVFTAEIHPIGNVNYSVASLSTLNVPDENFIGGGGNLTVSGTLRAGSTDGNGALQTGGLAGNVRIGGTRTFATNATIVYNGTGAQFIGNGFPSGGDVNLTIDNFDGVSLSSSLDIVALRTLNLANGNIVIGTQTLTINGTVTGSGGIVGGSSSNLVIGGTGNFGTLTFNGTNQLQNFTLNRTGSGLVSLGEDLTILGTFTHTNGTLAIDANVFIVSGNYGPSAPADLGVTLFSQFVIDGAGTLPSDISFAGTTLGMLTLNRASSTLTTSSTLTLGSLNLLSGIFDNGAGIAMATGGVITRTGGGAGGSMTTNPSNTTDAYDVVYAAGALTTGPELPSSTTALGNLSKTGTGAVTLTSDITVNGILTLSNGTFNAGANAIDLKGGFVSSAASTLTSSTVTFSGTTTISGSAPPTFGPVIITGVVTPNVNYRINGNLTNSGTLNAGSGSVTFGGSTVISGGTNSFNGLTIAASSSLTGPPSASISVAGNFANGGTFVHNSGTVIFNGTSTVTGTTPNFNTVTITGTFNAPANLNVAGNFLLNNGTFTHNSGTVTFNGTLAQNLNRNSGSGAATYDLFNVTVNKPSGIFAVESTIAGTTFTVANQFTIAQNGTAGTDVDFDGSSNTGTLVLLSTSTRTARIPAIPALTNLVGNLTVERFIPNNDGISAYRYLTPPVIGSSVADWQNEIRITGAFSDPSPGPGSNSPSMYQYIETTGGNFTARYQAYPNNIAAPASSFPLTNGRGYAVYGYSAGTPTINTRGTLRSGNFGVALTITGAEVDAAGFNLVGNPYPAPIDWDLVSLPGGVSSTISLKDNVDNAGAGTGNYVYYVQGGPNVGGFTGVIASGQAFWVETSSNTTLPFTEAQKVNDTNPILVREQSLADVLRINIQGNGKGDESVIWLQEEATDAADLRFDAKKKINDFINLYTFLESAPQVKYAINGVRDFGCSKSFKLGFTDINSDSVNVVTPGSYTLGFSQFETFTRDYTFTLLDKFENVLIDIRLHPEYTFEVTTDAETFGEDRFEILITQPDIQTDNVVHYDAVCENAEARVTIENSDPTISYEVKDHRGQLISNTVQGNGNSVVLILPKEKLVAGTNNLLVFAQNGLCEAVPLQQTVTLSVNEIYSIESVDNATSCKSGAVTLKAYGVPADGEYNWYDTETSTESIGTGSEWTTPVLDKSKTYYVAAKNALGCEGGRMEVKADVVQFEDAAISVLDNGALSSNYRENIQWYFNDTIIPDATNQEIIPNQSGVYKIEASLSGGCITSAAYEFSVTGIEEGLNKSVQVYPNPVIDRVSIELKEITPANAVILNSVGKAIGSVQFSIDGNHQKGEFNMGGESAGLYLIKIIQGKKVIHYKIIKK